MKTVKKTYKTKFSVDQIVNAAFRILREKGPEAVVARAVANELGSSTMPIYSYMKSKDLLIEALLKRALAVLYDYMTQERTGDMWIDWGVGHVIFALEEPQLFKLILRERDPSDESKPHFKLWDTIFKAAEEYPPFKGLSTEQVEMVMLRRYFFAMGFAIHLSKAPKGFLSDAQITDMIRGTSQALLEGARSGAMKIV
jgi:AcrR family transcriptional regulator